MRGGVWSQTISLSPRAQLKQLDKQEEAWGGQWGLNPYAGSLGA
jgi:hypothetical protein